MPSLVEVWDSRLGVAEVVGPLHNPTILRWCKDAGHPEIIDDETAWCSTSMCSAAKEAGLPFPPRNVNTLARSWLTMGVSVAIEDAKPGDVCVWPRNNSSWQGHVNMIREIRRVGGRTEVRCIGGNQGAKGAVTLTNWCSLSGTLKDGVRRLVPASVKDLRPHSSEIKKGDKVQNAGWLTTIIPAIIATITEMLKPVPAPKFESLPDQLTWWQTVLEGANAVARCVLEYPWLAGTVFAGCVMVAVGASLKRARVAKHAEGVPISSEVASLNEAEASGHLQIRDIDAGPGLDAAEPVGRA